MGDYTKNNTADHNYGMPGWIQHLSFGGLTEPSDKWLLQAKECERIFSRFHKTQINKDPYITKRIVNSIKKRSDLPEEVIKAFVLQRIYIKIKWLNVMKFTKLLSNNIPWINGVIKIIITE